MSPSERRQVTLPSGSAERRGEDQGHPFSCRHPRNGRASGQRTREGSFFEGGLSSDPPDGPVKHVRRSRVGSRRYQPVPRVPKMRYAKEGEEPKWAAGAHPLHPRRPNKKARFGPGLSFAEAYLADKPGVTVGLIPMAWGGRSIEQLSKGSEIYGDAIRHTKAAMQVGTLKGVLWHQGESDTVEQTRTDAYEKRLHRLIEDARKDLGNPQLPFIVGNLAEFYGTGQDHKAPDRVARITKIKEILRRLPKRCLIPDSSNPPVAVRLPGQSAF